MKLLIVLVLIVSFSLSCTKSTQEAAPSDLLYQKWKLTEIKNSDGNWETVSHESVIEFRVDGSIRYQKPEPACCSPVQFERQSQTLYITDTYGGEDCIYVDCASPSAYIILLLAADELILESTYGTIHPVRQTSMKYKPVK